MKQTEFFNATPMPLTVLLSGAEIAPPVDARLKPLDKCVVKWPDELADNNSALSWSIMNSGRQATIGTMPFDATKPQVMIVPGALYTCRFPGSATINFVNRSRYYIQIYWINTERSEVPYGSALAPDDEFTQATFPGHLWLARRMFTQEIFAMFVAEAGEAKQTKIIDDTFLMRKTEGLPLQSPIPEIKTVRLVGEADLAKLSKPPNPRSRDYIVRAESVNRPKPRFNTRKGVTTRKVRISGVELVWNEFDDNYGLMAYQGQNVSDIEDLEIYADRVIIASRLRFPGTNVKIFARELEFTAAGQIDTTPIQYTGPADSPLKTKDNKPARAKEKADDGPVDEQGTMVPTWKAADGLDGEAGGDVHLHVRKVIVPKNGEPQKRFITSGSQGQQAEKGGRKWYAPTEASDEPPVAKLGPWTPNKDVPPVTSKMISDVFAEDGQKGLLGGRRWLGTTDQWRWPTRAGETYNVEDVDHNPQGALFFPEAEDPKQQRGPVTYMKLIAVNDAPFARGGLTTTVVYLPTKVVHGTDNVPQMIGAGRDPLNYDAGQEPDPKTFPRRPGKGLDAYSGGKPGDGGKGGTIYTSLPLTVLPEAIRTLEGGAPGIATPEVTEGGEPGKPYPAYEVTLMIVNYDRFIDSSRKPASRVTDVSAKPGASAPARTGAKGEEGKVLAEGGTLEWLHPDALDAVLACAKDAYRSGFREFAANLLDPYYAVLNQKMGSPPTGPLAADAAMA